jgi:hypothetical protein
MRSRLRRLEQAARKDYISIPQEDGSVAKFPPRAAWEAMLNISARRGAGDDAPPEHRLLLAARNSSDALWSNSLYTERVDPYQVVEDLSE